jgi:Tfp pilus assembly protein PilV
VSQARPPAHEGGFTLVEVVVAISLLMIGVLATVTMVDQANSTTNSTKAREAGTGLAREVLEAARAIPYPELAKDTVTAKLQAQAGLADALPASGWQIQRRGFDYTVNVDVCLVDIGPPSDPAGPHDPASAFCSSGNPAPGTKDRNADDQKRVTVTLQWKGNPGSPTHSTTQTSVIANPAGALGPSVAALELISTSVLDDPKVIPVGPTAKFRAVTATSADAVTWSVDGQPQGTASENAGSDGLEWTFDWDVDKPGGGCCRFYDGTYTIGAVGSDATGRTGTPKTLRVRLNRRVPLAPDGFDGGYNPVDPANPIVDLVWKQNPERDVEGYRVYRVTATGEEQVDSCTEPTRTYTTKLECWDSAPQFTGDTATYRIRALDRDNSGNPGALREGDTTELTVTQGGNSPPTTPGNLAACAGGDPGCDDPDGNPAPTGTTVISWDASSDPDPGDSVLFYRIYRDGTAFADRLGKVFSTGASAYQFFDSQTGGLAHTYWVTAVDENYSESPVQTPGVSK